jgi:hypothetical protein
MQLLVRLLALVLTSALSSHALPPWSWDSIQVYVHCANISGAWAPWAAAQLARASFVVLEKPHGLFAPPVNTSAETKIADGCEQIKDAARSAGKDTDCYIYTEVDWARTYYSLGHTVDADLGELGMHYHNGSAFGTVNTLTMPNKLPGPSGIDTFHYAFHAYDFRSKKMQQLWAKRIVDAVATGHVDGAFIDGNRGGWGFGNTNACQGDKDCITDLKEGLEAAHVLAAKAVGPKATLISNYPTPEALRVANGGMCERCGHDANTVLQLQETYFGVNGTKRCGLFDQPCVLQYRCYGNNGQHGHETYTPYQDIGNRSIATFLLAMGAYSYYGGGSETGIGLQACNMSDGAMHFVNWPDVYRPLGAPRGDFKNTSFFGSAMLTRAFATGTRVVMNASGTGRDARDNFACVYWSDGFITGLGGPQPCPSQQQLNELFAAAGWDW